MFDLLHLDGHDGVGVGDGDDGVNDAPTVARVHNIIYLMKKDLEYLAHYRYPSPLSGLRAAAAADDDSAAEGDGQAM